MNALEEKIARARIEGTGVSRPPRTPDLGESPQPVTELDARIAELTAARTARWLRDPTPADIRNLNNEIAELRAQADSTGRPAPDASLSISPRQPLGPLASRIGAASAGTGVGPSPDASLSISPSRPLGPLASRIGANPSPTPSLGGRHA